MPSLPCVVAFSLIDLKTFGPLVLRSPPFYLVHPRRSEASCTAQDLRRLVATTVSTKLGGVLETSLWGPRVCAAISRPLHSSRGSLQPSPGLLCRWPSHLSLARFRRPQQTQVPASARQCIPQ